MLRLYTLVRSLISTITPKTLCRVRASVMSFWLDDDDNDDDIDPWLSQGSKAPPPSSSTSGTAGGGSRPSHQPPQYLCTNCGGLESYYDDATGTDVCASCFTQSQVIASTQQPDQETDWEDVMGLAARTTGGHFKQHKRLSSQQQQHGAEVTTDGRRRRRRSSRMAASPKIDDEYDESITLPDVQLCLRGMQCVLQKCVTIVVTDLLTKKRPVRNPATTTTNKSTTRRPLTNHAPEDDDDDTEDDDDDNTYQDRQRDDDIGLTPLQVRFQHALLHTVRDIWLSYCHAWSKGAEYYGRRYPTVRFSFRDSFCSIYQVSHMVRRYIPHRLVQQQQQAEEEKATGHRARTSPTTPDTTRSAFVKTECHDSNDDLLEVDGTDVINEEVDDADDIEDDNGKEVDDTKKQGPPVKVSKKRNSDIRYRAIQKVVRHHATRGRKMGYKEVALLIRPSMTLVAAMIHLAITKQENPQYIVFTTGITVIDVCDWIETGKLPLRTAFRRLLTTELQQKLTAVREFFGRPYPVRPAQLEVLCTQLCVACRLRIEPKILNHNDPKVGLNRCSTTTTLQSLYPAVIRNHNKSKGDSMRPWEMSHLPYIVARLVAMAGLNQEILDRSLVLIGYHITPYPSSCDLSRIPTIRPADQLSRIDELLAVIAIACQCDPQWRNWIYMLPEGESESTLYIPWNDSEMRLVRNGSSFQQYLKFAHENLLPENDNNRNAIHNTSVRPQTYLDATKSLSNIHQNGTTNLDGENTKLLIRPCRILDGAFAPKTVEVTNRTCKLHVDMISEHYHKKRQQRSEANNDVDAEQSPSHLMKTRKRPRDEAKQQIRKQTKNRKQQFRRTECDAMHSLPNHDFTKADRCNSDWEVLGDVDIDQMRLIRHLGFVTNINPSHIHRSMNLLLQPAK